jgi:dUTP pyrophosphatase
VQEANAEARMRSRNWVKVHVERLPHSEGLPLPSYATEGAVGLDVFAAVERPVKLWPNQRHLVPTGLKVAIPEGFELQVRPRSGLALKHGITIPNTPGTIDSDYRGEVQIIVMNVGTEPFTIRRGDRIAQLILAPVSKVEWEEVVQVSDTERGEGGFGHTGLNESTAEHQLAEAVIAVRSV